MTNKFYDKIDFKYATYKSVLLMSKSSKTQYSVAIFKQPIHSNNFKFYFSIYKIFQWNLTFSEQNKIELNFKAYYCHQEISSDNQ